jgi:uncharacterized linocin/CFP29 family protein
MQNLSKVGLATGTLTDSETYFLDNAIVKSVRPLLVGRTLMPTKSLAHAGFKTYQFYNETDMGQASIDMTGEAENADNITLTESHVHIPIIHKEYDLHWRDVLMRRNNGEDLNTQNATNAARQIAEEEDKLIITGEYSTWPALGIEGLASATGRNTEAGGDWSATYLTDVADAIDELETDGFFGPYKLILPSTFFTQLRVILANYGWAFNAVNELLGGSKDSTSNIVVSNSLYASHDSAQDSALVIDTSPGNFELIVAQDISNYMQQLPSMNYKGKVWEAVVPVIKRPTAICEITGLT